MFVLSLADPGLFYTGKIGLAHCHRLSCVALQPTVQPNQIAERLIRHLTYEPIQFADSRPARVFPRVSFGMALTHVTSVISAYVYDRPRSVEKQSIVVVSPLVEDQVADEIDDVLRLRNRARHPTQLGIWHCARPIFPV